MTSTVCAPKRDWKEPPRGPGDDKCKVENLRRTGDRMTWTMTCTEPKGMTGEGEMVHKGDGYTGKMTMRSEEGEMRMKMRGKLLGGACDANAQKREVAAIQKQVATQQRQADAAMAEACDDGAEKMATSMFSGPAAFCKDPKQRAKLCAQGATRSGYLTLKRGGPDAPRQYQELCGKAPDAALAKLCPAALKEAAPGAADAEVLDFLGSACPDETRVLAQRECAGRGFTGVSGSAYGNFCVRYARAELEAGAVPAKAGSAQAAQPEEKSMKEEAVQKGKGLVKGLFGK